MSLALSLLTRRWGLNPPSRGNQQARPQHDMKLHPQPPPPSFPFFINHVSSTTFLITNSLAHLCSHHIHFRRDHPPLRSLLSHLPTYTCTQRPLRIPAGKSSSSLLLHSQKSGALTGPKTCQNGMIRRRRVGWGHLRELPQVCSGEKMLGEKI